MASLRKAKKQAKKEGRVFKAPEVVERKRLIGSISNQIKETNRRLRALDRKGFYNSFSSKKLFEKLGDKSLTKVKGKYVGVKISKNMSYTELTSVAQATKTFLKSATSTPYKTKDLIRRTKKSMYATLKLKDDELTMDDIDLYYKILGDKDFDFFSDKQLSSEMFALFEDSKEKNFKEDTFIRKLNEIINISKDDDLLDKAKALYQKYARRNNVTLV